MSDAYSILIYPFLYILPAYVANASPILFGGGRALDFGKKLKNHRIFGPNKTIRGLIAGILAGTLIGFGESVFFPVFLPFMLAVGVAESLGTHFGDLLGSFIKRRFNSEPGKNVAFLDQYLFVIFALAFAYPLGNFPDTTGVIFILVLTGVLHVALNFIAHKIHLKSVPW